jgi:predicted RNA-binding protein with TRAM domain
MTVSDDLYAVFSAKIEFKNRTPVVEIPESELSVGELEESETYRIAIHRQIETTDDNENDGDATAGTSGSRQRQTSDSGPPVDEGDTLDVEIEDVGDQGDGLTRIGPGYVVFVPDTQIGDRVTVQIKEARSNFAFAEVVGKRSV